MSDAAPTRFTCPNCGARYKVVRIEAPPNLGDSPIFCVSCKAPIPAGEGRLALKYFQVERSPHYRRRTRSAGATSA